MLATEPPATTIGQPEGRHQGNPPLPSMAVAGEDQVDGMMSIEMINHVRRVCQQDPKSIWHAGWNTAEVGPMQARVVQADDLQLTRLDGHEGNLIDQKVDFVLIGHLGERWDRDAAEMVMVAEGDKHRS